MGKTKEFTGSCSVNFYLKDSELPASIQRMMKDLYKGQSRTLKEWKKIDEGLNKGRCK